MGLRARMIFTRIIPLTTICLALVLIMVVPVGCTPSDKPLEKEADFIGFITEVYPIRNGDIVGQILAESHADKLVEKYMVTINNETLIFHEDGGNLRKVDFQALVVKQWVKIWFTGPIMESFPMQGTAGQVVIAPTTQ